MNIRSRTAETAAAAAAAAAEEEEEERRRRRRRRRGEGEGGGREAKENQSNRNGNAGYFSADFLNNDSSVSIERRTSLSAAPETQKGNNKQQRKEEKRRSSGNFQRQICMASFSHLFASDYIYLHQNADQSLFSVSATGALRLHLIILTISNTLLKRRPPSFAKEFPD